MQGILLTPRSGIDGTHYYSTLNGDYQKKKKGEKFSLTDINNTAGLTLQPVLEPLLLFISKNITIKRT